MYIVLMKSILILLSVFLTAHLYAQPVPVEIKKLDNYYYIGAPLKSGVNCMVLSDRKQFEKMFGKTSRPDTPDFSKEWMLILAMPETKHQCDLSFQRVSMKAGQFIEVYCGLDLNKFPLTYKYIPLTACVIPKYKGIHKINFYDAHKMRPLTSVEVK